jgi:transcriptional regulator with XRE-family HTH domain
MIDTRGELMKSRLREVRISLNMTQEQLAAEFRVSPNTLARWERGESSPDGIGMLDLALEAMEARHKLRDGDFLSKKEAIKQSLLSTNGRLRQRVRHPRHSKLENVG